jgi:hypothetical protein
MKEPKKIRLNPETPITKEPTKYRLLPIDKKESEFSNEDRIIHKPSNNQKLTIQLVPLDKIIEKREKKNSSLK